SFGEGQPALMRGREHARFPREAAREGGATRRRSGSGSRRQAASPGAIRGLPDRGLLGALLLPPAQPGVNPREPAALIEQEVKQLADHDERAAEQDAEA